jgi:hypothetical protein
VVPQPVRLPLPQDVCPFRLLSPQVAVRVPRLRRLNPVRPAGSLTMLPAKANLPRRTKTPHRLKLAKWLRLLKRPGQHRPAVPCKDNCEPPWRTWHLVVANL